VFAISAINGTGCAALTFAIMDLLEHAGEQAAAASTGSE
jgi:hypothetical protein